MLAQVSCYTPRAEVGALGFPPPSLNFPPEILRISDTILGIHVDSKKQIYIYIYIYDVIYVLNVTCYKKRGHSGFFIKVEFLVWIGSSVCVENNGASFKKKILITSQVMTIFMN